MRIAKARENLLSHVSAIVINLIYGGCLVEEALEISPFGAFAQIHITTTTTDLYLINT